MNNRPKPELHKKSRWVGATNPSDLILNYKTKENETMKVRLKCTPNENSFSSSIHQDPLGRELHKKAAQLVVGCTRSE